MTRQLTKSRDFPYNFLCDCRLWKLVLLIRIHIDLSDPDLHLKLKDPVADLHPTFDAYYLHFIIQVQCCGSMKFWCGSGYRIRGSIPLTNSDLQDANKKLI